MGGHFLFFLLLRDRADLWVVGVGGAVSSGEDVPNVEAII